LSTADSSDPGVLDGIALICEQCGAASSQGQLGPAGTKESCSWFCKHCWDSWTGSSATRAECPALGMHDTCGRCGSGPQVSRPPPFCETAEAWLCPACWLRADAGANPFRALDVEEFWTLQAMAFVEQCPPDLAQLLADSKRPEPGSAEDPVPWGAITVLLDASDCKCAALAFALRHAFGGPLLRFIDFHDHEALNAVLARHPGMPWVPLCRRGGVSAVLANGLFISECERHPKVLLYELKYRRNVVPASPEWAQRIQQQYTAPLAALRTAFVPPLGDSKVGSRWWWQQPQAMALITTALAREKYVTIDGFLPKEEFQELMEACRRLGRTGQLARGNRGHGRVEQDEADLLNTGNQPRKWCMWDDNLTYCGDADVRAASVGLLYTRALDCLLSLLKLSGSSVVPAVSKRLEQVLFREKVMVACYRTETRGQYFQHVDSGGGAQRSLTAILYFNQGWTPEDGGFNRMYHEGWFNTEVKEDILPVANRLLLFWANEDCPHEVTAQLARDRYAMTVWFAHGPTLLRERLRCPRGRQEMIDDFHPVAPHSFMQAAVLSAPELRGNRQLQEVAEAYESKQLEA